MFYEEGMIAVRLMKETDIDDLAAAFRAQNWSDRKNCYINIILSSKHRNELF